VCISIACYVWVGRAGQSKHKRFWHGKQTRWKQTFQIANAPLVSTKALINIHLKIYLHKWRFYFKGAMARPIRITRFIELNCICYENTALYASFIEKQYQNALRQKTNNPKMVVFSLSSFHLYPFRTWKDYDAVDWEEYYEYKITSNGIISFFKVFQTVNRAMGLQDTCTNIARDTMLIF